MKHVCTHTVPVPSENGLDLQPRCARGSRGNADGGASAGWTGPIVPRCAGPAGPGPPTIAPAPVAGAREVAATLAAMTSRRQTTALAAYNRCRRSDRAVRALGMSRERDHLAVSVPPLRPVTKDELRPPGIRGSQLRGGELCLICVGVGAASFFLANSTYGISMLLGLLVAPLLVGAMNRARGSRRSGAAGLGVAAAIGVVVVWVLCFVLVEIIALADGASSPV